MIDFDGFGLPTSTSGSFKIMPFPKGKPRFFKKSPFEVGIDFGGHLGTNLVPFCIQNPRKSFKNQIPRGIKKLIDFGFDFWWFLAPFWEASWSHVGRLFSFKTLQDFQDAPRTPLGAPEPPSGAPKTPPRGFPDPPECPRAPPQLHCLLFPW